jgi:hypothetical protein
LAFNDSSTRKSASNAVPASNGRWIEKNSPFRMNPIVAKQFAEKLAFALAFGWRSGSPLR